MRLYTAPIVLFLFSTPILALDTENTRRSLRGLDGVEVLIEPLPTQVEQAGLTTSTVRTDVELKLRQAGIPVFEANRGSAVLHVNVSVLASRDNVWPYSVRVEVLQDVALMRDRSIVVILAETWNVAGDGSVGRQNIRNLRDIAKDQVDQFINAYLAVNPKK
jgi:predicted secreted protein